ncbi:proton-coupled folate transporter [Microplitis demolitor]|uniref:proton-coupled folate transporter n=1 Tax=Microplitis demolitor TaxID=69319 RepID=UPI0006D4FF22|nr:proton-coupled folate transporter [Microplitis demolitor]
MNEKQVDSIKTGWRHFILMEPPIFLLLLANGMTSNVLTDLILFQTCRQIMVTNKTSCDILHTNSSSQEARELSKIIQPHASYIIIGRSLIKGILPALLILFLGPWSDKYGRKPLIIAGYFVPLCRYIILFILSNFDANPWLYLLAYIPTALFGSGLLLATICYISDSTEPDKRAWRLACLQTCVKTGLVIGTFIGPLIFQKLGYTFLFIIAALLCLISLLYAVFMVPESVQNDSEKKWGNPFDFSLVKQLVLTCTKKREGLNRGMLWSCLAVLSLYKITFHGNSDISYLFANAKLGWNVVQYSMFSSVSMVLSIVGTFAGLKIMKDYIGLTDITGALIGCLSGFSASLCLSLVTESWHMYLEVCLGIFIGVILPTTRSLISRSAPADDLGKVFSLVTFVDTLLPLGSAPLYTLLYSSYMSVYPLPVYLLTSGIYFLLIIIIITINFKFIRDKSSSKSITQAD